MNETVMQRPLAMDSAPDAARRKNKKKKSSAFFGYTSLLILITVGWLARDFSPINPEDGVGYWLGIIGASMMATLLLYPLRKRVRLLRVLGPTKTWFKLHMILGLIGPLLILYHCNFQLGSFNSKVAFYCMLLVAGSGVIGRHFYARIHRGLYGRKTSLQELQKELAESAAKSHGMAKLMPELVGRLDALSNELQGCAVTQSLGVARSLKWTLTHQFTRLSLIMMARRELKAAASQSAVIADDFRGASRAAARYIRTYTGLMGRVAQFSFYERMFSLWHVFHLPIFFMMVITALFHVLAVHMY